MILNIRRKLLLSYLVMAFLTVVASAHAVWHLRTLNSLAETVVQQDSRLLDIEKKMMDTILAWEGVEKKYLILRDPSLADIFWSRGRDFHSQAEKLQQEAPPEQARAVAELIGLGRRYEEIFKQETLLVGEDRSEEALALSSHEGRRVVERMGIALRALQLQSEKNIDARMNAINVKALAATRLTIFLAAASLLIGLALAAAITFNISRPLRRLEKATGDVAEGRFDGEIEIRGDDEIGSLARAFNAMTKRLKVLEAMHIDASPLTGLPGNLAIEQEIGRRLGQRRPFCLCHLDLDNFKPFADHYGYAWGSEVIKEVAVILTECRQHLGVAEDFIGHIGGDDFILITEPVRSEEMCRFIVQAFDARVLRFYSEEDRRRGFIRAKDRQGRVQEFPLITITISIVGDDGSQYQNPLEMAKMAAEVKNYGKTLPGSNYIRKEDMTGGTGNVVPAPGMGGCNDSLRDVFSDQGKTPSR
ncbi:MAG TPA: HAMP domain-containing protein [Syntrophales bacterium]|jgi:GGDEF domain-containing protein/CHASE3 domain sensor protein|nr:HAMP domain-containing protein [Syntrophales bacterium]